MTDEQITWLRAYITQTTSHSQEDLSLLETMLRENWHMDAVLDGWAGHHAIVERRERHRLLEHLQILKGYAPSLRLDEAMATAEALANSGVFTNVP